MSNLSYEQVIEFIRTWSADPQNPPYDLVGTVHLLLAALDNLSDNAMPHELEEINGMLTDKQRKFIQSVLDSNPERTPE